MLERSVVDPIGFMQENLAGTTLPRNGNVRRQHDGVSIWENVSPHRVTSLWWSSHHDRARSQRRRHLRHALIGPLEHGRSTSRHGIGLQFFADVQRHTSSGTKCRGIRWPLCR